MRTTRLAAVLAVQAVLVGVAVAPQLSARLTGQEYRLAVAPVPCRAAPGARAGSCKAPAAAGCSVAWRFPPLSRSSSTHLSLAA